MERVHVLHGVLLAQPIAVVAEPQFAYGEATGIVGTMAEENLSHSDLMAAVQHTCAKEDMFKKRNILEFR